MTIQIGDRIDVADDTGSSSADDDARTSTVTALVLSAAAVLIGLATFVLGQWVAATDEAYLVDTADCRVIALASMESPDPSTHCDDPTDPSQSVAGDSAYAQGALPPSSVLGPSQVVAAPGLWIHSILQSVG